MYGVPFFFSFGDAKMPARRDSKQTVAVLRKLAAKASIKGYSKMRKAELIAALGKQPRRTATVAKKARPVERSIAGDLDIPCPLVSKLNLDSFLAAPALTKRQLGIYTDVRHALYPFPVGSARDRAFLLRAHDLYRRTDLSLNFWDAFIEEIATHQRVRDLCSLDNDGKPLHMHIGLSTDIRLEDTWQHVVGSVARANNMRDDQVFDAAANGVVHRLAPMRELKTLFINHRRVEWWTGGGDTQRWLEKAGVQNCGPDRPWLPISFSVEQSKDTAHALFLLINRISGQAYLFEPNGSAQDWGDNSDITSYRTIVAIQALPLIRSVLRLNESEWRTTHYINDFAGGGPQSRQGVADVLLGGDTGTCQAWSILFYHLFILNPKLTPDELLQRMLAPAQKRYLSHIIGRYSMFIAKNVVEQLAKRNRK